MENKLKIGIHGLTSCYGCQLRIASVQDLLKIASRFTIDYWTMLSSANHISPVDIAFVEGSVTTASDEEQITLIRENTDILVAVGSCAIHGGVQGLIYGVDNYENIYESVYGKQPIKFKANLSRPLDKFVKVDYRLPGCPPEEHELMYYLSTFAMGSYPEEKDFPVCIECRRNGYPCLLIEKDEPCLGPAIVAGCNARCLGYNIACFGCRGPVPCNVAWFDSIAKTFKEKGMSKEDILSRLSIFGRQYEKLDELVEKVFSDEN